MVGPETSFMYENEEWSDYGDIYQYDRSGLNLNWIYY